MNTIEEILRNKNILDYYVEKLCISCINRDNNEDLCNITHTIDGTVKCVNYSRCMSNKCKTCDKEIECFEEVKE